MRNPGVLFLLLLWGAAGLAHAQPKKVVAVRFEGNRRYDDAFLREQILTRAGEPLDGALISRDLRTLRRFFSQVTDAEEIEVEGGVEIVFHVVDRLVVGKVTVQGMLGVREEDYEPLLATRSGRPFHEHTLRSDKELLERLLKEKGFHFAEVRSSHHPARRARVHDVLFVAFPHRTVRVRDVVLEGAHSMDRADLLDGVQNSDRWRSQLLGWISPTRFNREALDQDRRRMELRYRLEGWLDARVVLVDFRFDDDRRNVSIRYRVDEGVRYTVEALEVVYGEEEGDRPLPEDREFLAPDALQGVAALAPGDPFREEDLETTRRVVRERLWQRYYARAQVLLDRHAFPERHTVRIRLTVRAGPKVRLGRQKFLGNAWT
ncbi:MAG: POTRA domain-containing protein, partial [Planctomycetota bacterium]